MVNILGGGGVRRVGILEDLDSDNGAGDKAGVPGWEGHDARDLERRLVYEELRGGAPVRQCEPVSGSTALRTSALNTKTKLCMIIMIIPFSLCVTILLYTGNVL